jgi:hypothetical protein
VIQEGLQISKKLRDSIYLEEKEREKGTVSLVDLSEFESRTRKICEKSRQNMQNRPKVKFEGEVINTETFCTKYLAMKIAHKVIG